MAIRLTNADLLSTRYQKVAAPFVRSTAGNTRGAAIARIGFYAQYVNPHSGQLDFDVDTVEIPPPFWEGDIYRLSIPNASIASIDGFIGSVTNPVWLLPGYWLFKNSILTLYTSGAYPLPSSLVIESQETVRLPTPDTQYRFKVLTNLTDCTKAVSEGLSFYPAPSFDTPHSQEFTQTPVDARTLLELYSSPNCYPRIGSNLVITGKKVATGLTRLCKASTFVFQPGLQIYPDLLDYQGKAFRRASNPWEAKVGEFLWDSQNKRLTAFGV